MHYLWKTDRLGQKTADLQSATTRVGIPGFHVQLVISRESDSWPRSLDDSEAKKDWGWHIEYGMDEMVEVMLALIQRDTQSNAPNAKAANA
ncbi:hypothetical protein Y032_0455g1754 [Ancylostoma ceylanicum]|nr:hypothetical protein Y032_0455g1754 [Ancylostoma ceylanicum]